MYEDGGVSDTITDIDGTTSDGYSSGSDVESGSLPSDSASSSGFSSRITNLTVTSDSDSSVPEERTRAPFHICNKTLLERGLNIFIFRDRN